MTMIKGSKRAFSLVEMLIVLVIVSMLIAFAAPALSSALNSYRLTSAGDSLMGLFSEAQQISSANNIPVEVRFFKYPDQFGANANFRSCRMFKVEQATTGTGVSATYQERLNPVGNLVKFSGETMVVAEKDLSPMLDGDAPKDEVSGMPNGYSGVAGATYMAVRFMPDGNFRRVTSDKTNFAQLIKLPLNKCYITITADQGIAVTSGNLPKNFYTIQLDPYTGRARNYKPGF